ncbi:nucleotide sugar dehydrogenase (plasmid) [Halorussus limi]|uniref:UDP-N-acetyl-D-mannosamine dehydrogenase n=1 Tax=Halorussus limi TaxID=2938695 RepID=A0A8U0I119_9EURY|nr:nucleotide sugar dehydrogenase [Halorussus limi]UPV76859.1 nucleotide sugar dehydrogenase [Halorussus limi]
MTSVCVHGLGYIGLPTAAVLADAGYEVVGYDVDEAVREIVRGGDSHVEEPELADLVAEVRESGALTVASEVPVADYHLVCVPTPFDAETREADLRYVRAAAEGVGEVLRAGDAVVLESTVPPGTTTGEFCETLAATSGLDSGADFSLAHCPETVLPGDMLAELRANDRLVGGVDDASAEAARALYDPVVEGEISVVPDPTTAEFAKLIQNTYRDVNVALANEVAKLADDYGVSSRAVIEAANDHPRVDLLRPGPGVGGHCLPVDPWFLGRDSDSLDLAARAREINDGMPSYVADRVARHLGSLDGRKVAVLGVAYKGNVDDTRGSPGLALADELRSRGADVTVQDPHVTGTVDDGVAADGGDPALELESLVGATRGADALVATAAHEEYGALAPGIVTDRMADEVVVDACDALDRERWRGVGATVETL